METLPFDPTAIIPDLRELKRALEIQPEPFTPACSQICLQQQGLLTVVWDIQERITQLRVSGERNKAKNETRDPARPLCTHSLPPASNQWSASGCRSCQWLLPRVLGDSLEDSGCFYGDRKSSAAGPAAVAPGRCRGVVR